MIEPFAFRALSPHHATAMDLDYLLRVVAAARKYGYNALQICGATHGDVGNLDGLTEFVRFGRANDVRDMAEVARQREILRAVCRAAHDAGIEVYYWHHELWYPRRLSDVYPDWFVPAPANRFTRDVKTHNGLVPRVEAEAPIWDFMDAKFDEAFAQCPELDGTVMTIHESHVPIYCLFEDFDRQVAELLGLYERLDAAHRRVGKKWILRTFAWREHEYRVVTAAIERFGGDVPVESKGVPMDWSLYYPYDPLLGKFKGKTRHVELAPSCEFHGCTSHPVGNPWFYMENLRFAAARGHTGAVLRMDRARVSMLGGPDEGVLAVLGAWLNDPEGADLRHVWLDWLDWLRERYRLDDEGAGRLMYDVMDNCWRATLRTYHHGKIYIGDAFGLRYDRQFFVAERDRCVEYDDPDPLAEKDQAVALADRAAAALETIADALSPADHADLARRVRLLQLATRAFRALVAALVARQKQMYQPSEAYLAALASAIDDLAAAGQQVTDEMPEREALDWSNFQGHWQLGPQVRAFARAFRADVANLPVRKVVHRVAAAQMGAHAAYRDGDAHQPAANPTRVELIGRPGAGHVLAVFAATEMCVRRPLLVRCPGRDGDDAWEHRFDVGQYAWFLAHDRYRRYEVPVPARCFDAAGRIDIELSAPEPHLAPYLREVRLETETPPA